MKKILLSVLLISSTLLVKAQKVYFAYLQSEQNQAFFVRLSDKTFSSSASGYLILSHLRDSTYTFSVGFPGNTWPDQHFSLAVEAKDHGYLLKNFGEKGWGLFDLQTLAVQMANNTPTVSSSSGNNTVSPFTDILARAAGDSSLREKPAYVVAAEQAAAKKAEMAQTPVVTPTATTDKPVEPVADTLPAQPAETPRSADKIPESGMPPVAVKEMTQTPLAVVEIKEAADTNFQPSVISRQEAVTTQEGVAVTYFDTQAGGKKDTIQILIPGVPEIAAASQPSGDRKFLEDISTDTTHPAAIVKEEPVTTSQNVEAVPVTKEPVAVRNVYKTECKEVATDADLIKVRKKMVAEDNDDDMVDQARKYFKTKCFTTEQLRILSTLFLQEIGKYKFFDMSYVFVSDPGNFPSLVSELKNDYYINRFNAMIRN